MKNIAITKQPTSVIGLGQMGTKLAELLVENSIPVTVWNRSIEKSKKIKNVQIAGNAAAAIAANDIVVFCVFDYAAVNEILDSIQGKLVLLNKTIINLTTGDAGEATQLAARIESSGGKYLDGAIQVAPDEMGKEETTILISGDGPAFDKLKDMLTLFAGNLRYLGQNAAAANSMDLATLAWLYGSFTGLIHGAALLEHAGMDVQAYSEIISEITPGFTNFFAHELAMIKKNDYTISQSPLSISVSATQRIRKAIESAGIDSGFHTQIESILQKAAEGGYANEELAAIIKVIR